MLRRFASLLPACFAIACSSAHEEGPKVAGPAPKASITAVAKAPRKLTGTPVVVTLRRPTPVKGVEWAWLMPEGRLVTLAPSGAEGALAILGPNFFGGPNGLYVGLEASGDFAIAADGEVHPIGASFEMAGFDDKGAHVLMWNGTTWGLFARDGQKLRGDERYLVQPSLLGDGRLVEHVSPGVTRVIGPDGALRMKVGVACTDLFPSADRMLCKEPHGMKGPEMVVFGMGSADELARFPVATARSAKVSFAARADGGAIARATETVELFEVASGAKKASSHVVYRRPANMTWLAPRMAFTPDGKRLCVEEIGGTRVLDPNASEFKNERDLVAAKKAKTRSVCFFAPRGNGTISPVASSGGREWEGVLVNVPVHEGWEVPASIVSREGLETTPLSLDRKVGAIIEQRGTPAEGDTSLWSVQAVVVDAATGEEKRTIPLGTYKAGKWTGADGLLTELFEDGATLQVCSAHLFQSGCRQYATATGAEIAPDRWTRPGPARTGFNVWSGEWPEARSAEVLAAMSVPVETKAHVVAWSDEGKYVSMEIDPGDGATVHLNMPDSAEHVVRDVVAVAGGAMLALASQGIVELWAAQPLELMAVLVQVPEGGVAMFADGSVEVAGKGASALGCQQGEKLVPVAACGDLWATTGTLAALMKSARNSR